MIGLQIFRRPEIAAFWERLGYQSQEIPALPEAGRGLTLQAPRAAGALSLTRTDFISFKNVSKIFGAANRPVQALQTIDLDIAEGEFVSFIGPSGCGKSTLLMLLAGLISTTTGVIEANGRPITGPIAELGFVFQTDTLLEWRTALENILLQAEIRRLDKNRARREALRLLQMVGLDEFTGAYPHELSGGMRQRVSICRALLHEPALLLMDEPFGALDSLTRDQLQVDLLRLRAGRKMTVLFVTHSISEAIFLSDRVVVMSPRPGKIEQIIAIDIPRPRRLAVRESAAFAHYNQMITSIFKRLGVLREDDA